MSGSRPMILFIAGSGRSGSTVVARYVEQAAAAVHVGELRYMWERGIDEDQLCECGETFSSCPFWTAVLGRAYPSGTAAVRREMVDLADQVDRLRRVPADIVSARGRRSRAAQRYGEVMAPLYEAIREISGAPVVIDSSKDPSYLFALHATGRFDLRVVHLVRDSRAVAYSWTRAKKRPEVHWEEREMAVHAPSLAARRWVEVNLAMELFDRLGRRTRRLRYEDFAAEPEAVTRTVLGELGVAARADPGPVPGHSFSGNPMRFDRAPLRVRPDTAWVSALAPRDRQRVTRLTFPLLWRYGYPVR